MESGDIVYSDVLPDRVFKIIYLEEDDATIKDILLGTEFILDKDKLHVFDIKNLDLSKPRLIMMLIDVGLIKDSVAIDLYNKHDKEFEKEHLEFIDLMIKRSPLNSNKGIDIKVGLGWC